MTTIMASSTTTPKKPSVFQGELMVCIMCGQRKHSNPLTSSNWRAFATQGNTLYVCPNHFPDDGASAKSFDKAYRQVIERILLILVGNKKDIW